MDGAAARARRARDMLAYLDPASAQRRSRNEHGNATTVSACYVSIEDQSPDVHVLRTLQARRYGSLGSMHAR